MPAGTPTVVTFGANVLNKSGEDHIGCNDYMVTPTGEIALRCDQMSRYLQPGENAVTMYYRDSSGNIKKFTNRYYIHQ